jgi:hypothetical protein
MRHAGLPQAPAVASTAQGCAHNVEPEKGKSVIIVDNGDGGRRLAIDLAKQEAYGIDGRKAGCVGEPGVPALRCRPINGKRNLARLQRPYAEVREQLCASRLRGPLYATLAFKWH